MSGSVWVVGLVLAGQVPAPGSAEELSAAQRRAHRAILEREAGRLRALIDREPQAAEAVRLRAELARARPANGAARLVPLPEIVPAAGGSGPGLANVPAGDAPSKKEASAIEEVRRDAARALFTLAEQALAAQPSHPALAEECLRGVLERDPDHAEARRLLGYVPHQGGWATPYALRQLQEKKVRHPTYGWVPATWVPHLDQGELPAPLDRGQKQPRWLPAAEADRLHGDWPNRWKISTEHFEIHTDVPLAEAIAFGERLEHLHQVFLSVLADVFGPALPLAQRFHNKKLVGEPAAPPHVVDYFATRAEFIAFLEPLQGPTVSQSLGVYIPPKPRGPRRMPAYFFRDDQGQLPVTATLYHEVSHQLLFESGLAEPGAFEKNDGNFWVFEGLGTYFETLVPTPDGALEIGGVVGSRMERAVERLVGRGELIPTDQLVRFDQNGFNAGDIFLKYQEANALTVYLMQADDERYREGFLDYVRDAVRGRLKRVTGRTLADRVALPYSQIDAGLIAYLKARAPRP